MIVKTTLLCLLVIAVSSEHVKIKTNEDQPFGWHFEYSVEGTKRYESTGYTSHIKFWRSMDLFARIDVNEEITRIYNRNAFGARYEIRYGSGKYNNTACCMEQGTITKQVRLVRWLPYFPDFEPAGYEMVKGVRCVKFTEKTKNKDKNVFWAIYHRRHWVPIRYRMRVTDSNNYIDHVIYDYFKFQPSVDMEVFDVYKTNICTNRKNRKVDHNDELAKTVSNEVFDEDHESLISDVSNEHSDYDTSINKMPVYKDKALEIHHRLLRNAPKSAKINLNEDTPFGWHFEYSLEGTKRYESTGYTSHIKFWRSMDLFARIDVNEEITRIYNRNAFGARYEIRYGSGKYNNTACCMEQGTIKNQVRLVRWLPYFPDFEPVGYETVKGVRCMKFTEKTKNKDKNVFWAIYHRRYWVPISLNNGCGINCNVVAVDKFLTSLTLAKEDWCSPKVLSTEERKAEWNSKELYKYRMRVTDSNNYIDHVIYDYFKFQPRVDMEVFDVYKTNICTNKKNRKIDHNDELAKRVSNEVFDEDHESLISDAIKEHSDFEASFNKMPFYKNKALEVGYQRLPRDTARSDNAKEDSDQPLRWPNEYNVEATKLYLTSGWTEQLKYWQSTSMSRLEAGAATTISKPNEKKYGLRYEFHPETTEHTTNKKVCYKIIGSRKNTIKPVTFLPSTVDFEKVGNDVVKGRDCSKFTESYEVENNIINKKLWAYFDDSIQSWVPVRYESHTSDTRHGYLKDHMIYDYYNFHPNVDEKVFKVPSKKYKCKKLKTSEGEEKVNADIDSLKNMSAEEQKDLDDAFAQYKQRFNKQYAHDAEHTMRRSIFYKKWRLVSDSNRRNSSYKLALNKMSDRTEKELQRYRGLRRAKSRPSGNIHFPYSQEDIKKISKTLPSQYDLRLEGVVGPVVDQEDCGSCWTFGTTAAVEGALARRNGGTLITLSNQALLDCSWGMGNGGCDGGDDVAAYKWITKHGLPTVEEYGPYIKEDGYCHIKNMTKTYKIRGWTNVTPLNENALKIAILKHGPLSVSLHATDTFLHYDGGILYDNECSNKREDLNHEVTLVGYGEKDGESFWIIKNSYGPYWGLGGYVHMSTRDNNCGVMLEPTYVVME